MCACTRFTQAAKVEQQASDISKLSTKNEGLVAKLDEMHGEWQGAMSETSTKRAQVERELEEVKRQAEEAAVNGRARIQAAEQEIERMRRNAMDAELADAAAKEFQEALRVRVGQARLCRLLRVLRFRLREVAVRAFRRDTGHAKSRERRVRRGVGGVLGRRGRRDHGSS